MSDPIRKDALTKAGQDHIQFEGWGVIDTGSDRTGISAEIAAGMGFSDIDYAEDVPERTATAGGYVDEWLLHVGLVFDALPFQFVLPSIRVARHTAEDMPPVLIGLDILKMGRLSCDWKDETFTLSLPHP